MTFGPNLNLRRTLTQNSSLRTDYNGETATGAKNINDLLEKFYNCQATINELIELLNKMGVKYDNDGNVLKFKYYNKEYEVVHNTKQKDEERAKALEEAQNCVLPVNNGSNAVYGPVTLINTNNNVVNKSPADKALEIVEAKRASVENQVKQVLGYVDQKAVDEIMNALKEYALDYASKYPGSVNSSSFEFDLLDIIWDYCDKLREEKAADEAREKAKREEEAQSCVLPENHNSQNIFLRARRNIFLKTNVLDL